MLRTSAAAVLAVAVAIATASPALAGEAAGYGKTQGAIPGILVGPKLNLIALPPGIGVEAKLLENSLGLSFDLGIVPPVKLGEASASWLDWSFGARYYPWRARFYLGAAVGSRTFAASATDSSTGVDRKAKADVTSFYLAPELGWKFVWDGGFFMGIDLGYQIIVSKKVTLDIPGGIDPKKSKDVTDAADNVGKIGLPVLTLLQVGYFF
jgi:hypothetical protein